jgi:excisionase family DNA binding protein
VRGDPYARRDDPASACDEETVNQGVNEAGKGMRTRKLLTVDEAADALTLKPKTIRAWIASRRIGIVRIGRAIRIPLSEIDRLIEEGTIPAVGV